MGVACARIDEELESRGVDVEDRSVELPSEFSSSWAVLWVLAVVLAAGVVEVGEEFYDIGSSVSDPGQPQAIFAYTLPVREAVDAVPSQRVLCSDCLDH